MGGEGSRGSNTSFPGRRANGRRPKKKGCLLTHHENNLLQIFPAWLSSRVTADDMSVSTFISEVFLWSKISAPKAVLVAHGLLNVKVQLMILFTSLLAALREGTLAGEEMKKKS